jgi:uncharacterized protein (TIGR02266 family)
VTITVSYKNIESFGVDFALNVARKVIFITSERPLSAGTEVAIAFEVPGMTLPFEIEGVVRWTSHPGASGKPSPGMGVDLTGLGPEIVREIEGYIRKNSRPGHRG